MASYNAKDVARVMLGGLDRPSEGEVDFQGTPLSRINLDLYRARQIGFVFQSFHLLATLSAVENVQVPMFEAPWSRRARAERAEQLIADVGLAHRRNHRPTRLSVGERQRVTIARARPTSQACSWRTNQPVTLIAATSTRSSNFWNSQHEIIQLLELLRHSRGLTLVLVTHSPEIAAAAGRVIRLRDGLIQNG